MATKDTAKLRQEKSTTSIWKYQKMIVVKIELTCIKPVKPASYLTDDLEFLAMVLGREDSELVVHVLQV